MSGFCVHCGKALTEPRRCPDGHLQVRPGKIQEQKRIDFPKPPTGRRLLGAGTEFLVYALLPGALFVMTLGTLDALAVPIVILMIALRDVQAGCFSIAKRVGHSRVVDYQTGHPATNGQAVKRNAYYILLIFLMVSPVFVLDAFLWFAFWVLIAVDVALIVSSPKGRRLGDRLAGTQVVPEKRGAT